MMDSRWGPEDGNGSADSTWQGVTLHGQCASVHKGSKHHAGGLLGRNRAGRNAQSQAPSPRHFLRK